MQKKKILLTGADGLLGANLVRELLNREFDVSVFLLAASKDPLTLRGLNINRYFGNILNQQSIEDAVKGHDYVIHAAASTVVFPARLNIINKVNIEGTNNVVKAVLKHNVEKLIHIGTANSFKYGSEKSPGTEENPYYGHVYGLDYMDSKKKAQDLVLNAVKEKNLNATVVNPTFMIGPYDSKPSSGSMIIALKKGKVPGFTVGAKNYIAVKDAATAIVNAIELGKKGECYILGNHNMTFKEAFEIFSKVINAKTPKLKLSTRAVQLYGYVNSVLAKPLKYTPAVTKELAKISCESQYYCSCKAKDELKMPVTPIEIAVRECYDWFKENNYL